VESSIVDCSASPPRLLRPGGLAVETIRQFAPDLEIVAREVGDDEAMPAPGMLLRHYSPDVPVILFEGPDAAVRHAIRERMAVLIAEGVRVGLLIADEDRPLLAHANAVIASLGTLSDLAQVARRLYAALRELEAQHVQVILARSVVDDGPGLAVRDRLRRAAAGKVVSVPPAES
jgi:L-threonylcarbamoyladenylate synthase